MKSTKYPNIVFIMADDMGYGDLSCTNPESKIPTPVMDRLAGEGITFSECHTPSAVCTPTRYGVLTGRYCWRSRLKQGVLNGYSRALIEPGRLTVASLLKQRGYHTACIGKWHLGLGDKEPTEYDHPLHPGPVDLGFDYFFGIAASLDMPPYVFIENDHPIAPANETMSAGKQRREGGSGFWREGAAAPGFRHEDVLPRITEKAVDYIEEQAQAPSPFFLYFPLTAPHLPWMPTKEFHGKSKAGWYGDFVTQVDASVGQVVNALDEAGLSDNTLLIVTSDNGARWKTTDIAQFDHLANYGRRGQKSDVWDGGHRVPMIARWPGKIAPGTRTNEIVCLTDLLATCAALTDWSVPNDAGEDSYNILPALLNEPLAHSIREAVVHHSGRGMFAIRRGRWKLILGLGSGGNTKPVFAEPADDGPQGQLFDLDQDPKEQQNLWGQHPEIVAQLTALLDRYKAEGHSRPMN